MFMLNTHTRSPLSYKTLSLPTPKKKYLLTYSILIILVSSSAMAETSKEKSKNFITLPDGQKQYLDDDMIIPPLKDSKFGVPINRADIEAAGSTVEEYMDYLRSQRKPAPEPLKPDPVSTGGTDTSEKEPKPDAPPEPEPQNANNDKSTSGQDGKTTTTNNAKNNTATTAVKETAQANPPPQTRSIQPGDEQPEVSSAVHAAHLMRQTTIIAISNITAHLNRDTGRGINSGSSFSQNNFWGNINYFTGSHETDITGKYDLYSTGLTLGYDYTIGHLDELILGGAFTYAKGKTDRSGKNIKMDQNLYLGSLYSKFLVRQFDILAAVHFGTAKNFQELGSLNNIKSDYDSALWGLSLQSGCTLTTPQINIKPLVEFNYFNSSFDDINIAANKNKTQIQNSDVTITELGVGVQLFRTSDLRGNKGKVRFHGQLMAYHDFNDDKQETKIPLTTHPFNNEIKTQARYHAGAGVSIQTRKNMSFGLDYDYFWSDKSNINVFALRVGYLF